MFCGLCAFFLSLNDKQFGVGILALELLALVLHNCFGPVGKTAFDKHAADEHFSCEAPAIQRQQQVRYRRMASVNGLLQGVIDGVPPEHPMISSQVWLGVRDVMSRAVVTVSPDDTLDSAANAMSCRNISCVVVLEQGAVTGILTERDLLKKVVAGGTDFGKAKVRDVMSSPVECTAPKSSILEAGRIMEAKCMKRLPVLHSNHLVGIVTQTDLTKALTTYGLWRSVRQVMTTHPVVVQTKATVADAAKIMSARNASCVVVLEGEEVAGVLTERDVLKRVI